MKRFSIKAGDRVFVSIFTFENEETNEAIVKGFTAIGIHYEDHGSHHYCDGLFYGFGYHSDGHVLVVRKKWHIPFAVMCEKLRLSLSDKWAEKLRLQ